MIKRFLLVLAFLAAIVGVQYLFYLGVTRTFLVPGANLFWAFIVNLIFMAFASGFIAGGYIVLAAFSSSVLWFVWWAWTFILNKEMTHTFKSIFYEAQEYPITIFNRIFVWHLRHFWLWFRR